MKVTDRQVVGPIDRHVVRVIDRHLLREMLLPTAAALALMFQLMVALQLLRRTDVLLGPAVGAGDVLGLLWHLTPHYLVLSIPVAVLLGALIGLGQLAEDRELDALYSAGVSPFRLLLPPLALAAASAALVLGLVLGPESAGLVLVRQRFDSLLKMEVQRDVRPGLFYDEVRGLTLFAESIDSDGSWRNVLVSDERDPRAPVLILAHEGRPGLGSSESALTLDLGAGEAHRQQSEGDDYTALRFRSARLSVSVEDSLLRRNTLRSPDDERTLGALWRAAHGAGEPGQVRSDAVALHRRIGLVLASLAFVWLGVPLAIYPSGAANARARGYLVAALALVGWYVLLRVGQALGQEGRVPPWVGCELPNAAFAAAGLLAWRSLTRRV